MYQKKAKKTQIKKTQNHSPTLKTIKMVEDILKNLELYTITFAGLKRKLPKKVNHNTLKEIIRYLDSSNKIFIGVDGITWIYNPSKKFKKAVSEATRIEPEDIRKILAKINKKS
jgi:hypothetical protein